VSLGMLITQPVNQLASFFAATMPMSKATVNTKTSMPPDKSDASAGPGQYPAKPHPMPNKAAPTTSLPSMSLRVGSSKRGAAQGLLPVRGVTAKATKVTKSAPPITKASEASHAPKRCGLTMPPTLRKPITLLVCVMPDTTSPMANKAPESSEKRSFLSILIFFELNFDSSQRIYCLSSYQNSSDCSYCYGDHTSTHKHQCRHQGAHRPSPQAAHPVPAGTARAQHRAKAHQQASRC
jgi:hypothetical protein